MSCQPVTGNRLPTPEREVASSVTIITADDGQGRSLTDILKEVPGLNLVQNESCVASATWSRSTDSNHTKVLVDGIDVSDPSSAAATFDFAQFLTQKSNQSRWSAAGSAKQLLYGSDTIGGVVDVITKSSWGPRKLCSFRRGWLHFRHSTRREHFEVRLTSFTYENTNVDAFTAAPTVTPLELLAPGESRNDDYYDNLTASTKLGYET